MRTDIRVTAPSLVLPVMVATLAGCAASTAPTAPTVGWHKPGISLQTFAQDKYECTSMPGAYIKSSRGQVELVASQSASVTASSGTTANDQLFQSCMEARGYIKSHEASQQQQSQAETDQRRREADESAARAEAERRAVTEVTADRFAAARDRCRAKAGDDPVCDQLTAEDVIRSEAAAAKANH